MLRKKLALVLYLTPFALLSISMTVSRGRVDENPPTSIQENGMIPMDINEMDISVYEDSIIGKYVQPIKVQTQEIQSFSVMVEEEPIVEPEFVPIGTYYDEIKDGHMEFDRELQDYLWNKSNESGIDFYLLMSQICEESEYKTNAKGRNSNGTTDMGLVQINSRYLGYFSEMMGRDIDPYNPYDAIDFLIWFHGYEKQYWRDRGLDGEKLDMAILGSYNKGRDNMRVYVRNNGYQYYYNKNIIYRRQQLIEEHGEDIQTT